MAAVRKLRRMRIFLESGSYSDERKETHTSETMNLVRARQNEHQARHRTADGQVRSAMFWGVVPMIQYMILSRVILPTAIGTMNSPESRPQLIE
jgi:hypothetical protein